MASVWKTAGVGAAAGLAVPVAGLSGLAAAGLTLGRLRHNFDRPHYGT